MRWRSIGEELLEQIGIMSFSNVRVTPVIALPVSTVPDYQETNLPRVERKATHLTRLTRWTCPADRLSYSEQFTAAQVNEHYDQPPHPLKMAEHFQLSYSHVVWPSSPRRPLSLSTSGGTVQQHKADKKGREKANFFWCIGRRIGERTYIVAHAR